MFEAELFPLVNLARFQISKGLQIVYVPQHIADKFRTRDGQVAARVVGLAKNPKIDSSAAPQLGFVTSVAKNGVFCRYYYHPSVTGGSNDLRTTANSELTPIEMLYLYEHRSQKLINTALEIYCGNKS